jgi:hypothetical protein
LHLVNLVEQKKGQESLAWPMGPRRGDGLRVSDLPNQEPCGILIIGGPNV